MSLLDAVSPEPDEIRRRLDTYFGASLGLDLQTLVWKLVDAIKRLQSLKKERIPMDLNLKDKIAVVTGASKGIGLAVVKALAREGARVVAGSRTTSAKLAAVRDAHEVTVVGVDLGTADGPVSLVRAAVDCHGKIDVLVNNLGATSPRTGFLEVNDGEWQRVFDLTFFSAVRASRTALPHLLAAGGGAIVNISSINARLPFPMVVDYSAAKAALTNLTKALSEEFAVRKDGRFVSPSRRTFTRLVMLQGYHYDCLTAPSKRRVPPPAHHGRHATRRSGLDS